MAAYLFSFPRFRMPIDPPESGLDMRDYPASVSAIVESFGGEYLVFHKPTRLVEGDLRPEFITMIRFPSMERLDAFLDSPQYQPWRALRHSMGPTDIFVADDAGDVYIAL